MTMFQNLFRAMEPHEGLQAECEACARKADWSKQQACRIFGRDATPADIRRRLWCATADRLWRGCGFEGSGTTRELTESRVKDQVRKIAKAPPPKDVKAQAHDD